MCRSKLLICKGMLQRTPRRHIGTSKYYLNASLKIPLVIL
jgi:hypothetical protein